VLVLNHFAGYSQQHQWFYCTVSSDNKPAGRSPNESGADVFHVLYELLYIIEIVKNVLMKLWRMGDWGCVLYIVL